MKITITFSDDNAAFEDNGIREYRRIFQRILEHIEDDRRGKWNVRDSNGNTVGSVMFEVE
jgi:hypothetical protein